MVNLRTTLEARFGIPFAELMQRFADIDFSRSDTAAVLNVSYQALIKLLHRHGDPFPAQSMTVRYRKETGGSLLASACYLAQTHSRLATARELGVSEGGLRHAIKLTFCQRRATGRMHRATGMPRGNYQRERKFEAFGCKGTLEELTDRFGVVGLRTVRGRVYKRMWKLEKALTTPIKR